MTRRTTNHDSSSILCRLGQPHRLGFVLNRLGESAELDKAHNQLAAIADGSWYISTKVLCLPFRGVCDFAGSDVGTILRSCRVGRHNAILANMWWPRPRKTDEINERAAGELDAKLGELLHNMELVRTTTSR